MKRWMTCLVVLTTLAVSSAAFACPNCRDSIPATDQAASSLPGGFNLSIYVMLTAFMGVLGGVTTMLVKTIRADADRSRR